MPAAATKESNERERDPEPSAVGGDAGLNGGLLTNVPKNQWPRGRREGDSTLGGRIVDNSLGPIP